MKTEPVRRRKAGTKDEALDAEALAAAAINEGARQETSFRRRGWESFKQTMREAARYRDIVRSPHGMGPLLVFTVIGAIAGLEGQVFILAFPEIIRDLDIDLLPLIGIFSIVNLFLIFIGLAFAWLMDRVRRTPFVAIGTMVYGAASAATAGVGSDVGLGVTQGTASVGGEIITIPESSLLADYYPPDVRGKVFAFSGVTGRVLRITAPVIVAYIITATSLGWRLPYLICGPLLILAGIWALFVLKEPVRGYMERRALGLAEEDAKREEDPVSFGEAWRTIWAIKTLRRLFIAGIPSSIGDYIFGLFFSLLLFEKYGLSIRDRAFLFAGLAIFALPFGFYAGGIVDVLIRRRPQRVLVFTGGINLVGTLFLFWIASAPPLWVLAILSMGFGAVGALFGPARGVLFVQILPAHVRTMGGAIPQLAAVPATIFRFFIIGYVVTRWGTQGALYAAVPLIVVSALIELSAAGLLNAT